MAEQDALDVEVPLAFRRKTQDLKDLQDALKSVVHSGGQ